MMYEAQYDAPVALEFATVTKLVRNLCMIAVIPLVGILYGSERSAGDTGKVNYLAMIPWFIVGFALMSAIAHHRRQGERPFGMLEPAAVESRSCLSRDPRRALSADRHGGGRPDLDVRRHAQHRPAAVRAWSVRGPAGRRRQLRADQRIRAAANDLLG